MFSNNRKSEQNRPQYKYKDPHHKSTTKKTQNKKSKLSTHDNNTAQTLRTTSQGHDNMLGPLVNDTSNKSNIYKNDITGFGWVALSTLSIMQLFPNSVSASPINFNALDINDHSTGKNDSILHRMERSLVPDSSYNYNITPNSLSRSALVYSKSKNPIYKQKYNLSCVEKLECEKSLKIINQHIASSPNNAKFWHHQSIVLGYVVTRFEPTLVKALKQRPAMYDFVFLAYLVAIPRHSLNF